MYPLIFFVSNFLTLDFFFLIRGLTSLSTKKKNPNS